MSAIASLSRFASLPRLALALVPIALLLAACGGGDPGDAAPTTDRGERADRPARSDSADTTDAGTPDAGQSSQAQQSSETAAAPDFPLDRVFVEVVGIEGFGLLNVVSAQPAVELLVGLVQPDGTPWDPFDLADELGLIGVYEVIYTTFDPESLVVATIEVARFADARGAERLLEIVRMQPLGAGETVVTVPPGLQLAGAFANIYDSTSDPQAGSSRRSPPCTRPPSSWSKNASPCARSSSVVGRTRSSACSPPFSSRVSSSTASPRPKRATCSQ